MLHDPSVDAFILANTQICTAPLVPEIRLRLASRVVPLWQATETQLRQAGVDPPYWAFCWPGSQALARLLLDQPERAHGRTVLDLAAGCGIAALAAARSGGRAAANDIDALALRAISLNAAINVLDVALQEGDLLDDPARGRWQLVLAGDVCYQRPMADRCLAWLRRQAAAGSEVLLADPGRAYVPSVGLAAVARYTIPTSRELEDCESRTCTIWRVLP